MNRVFIIMGVSGCGKSTIGELLAKELKIPFFDGDDFHSEENVAKMASGTPLNDSDRKGWLQSLNNLSKKHRTTGAVVACSALKVMYRDELRKDVESEMVFVHLSGSFDEVLNRLKGRRDHYMPIDLLKSQFATLEPPKKAITISINGTPKEIVSEIISRRTQKKP